MNLVPGSKLHGIRTAMGSRWDSRRYYFVRLRQGCKLLYDRNLWFGRRLIPVYPDRHGWYFRLSGTQYQHNKDRLAELLRYAPMHTEEYRGCPRKYYPAILLPDPTPAMRGTTARPLAVCSRSGYIGSAWQDAATELRPEVDSARGRGEYMFTRLRVEQDPRSVAATAWIPTVWLPCEPFD
jgi:hypothetical protein